MSFASKVLYTGDAVTTDFNVPMPYISQSHVNVYVNTILQLSTMHYSWSGPSTISFVDAPEINDAIEIKRWTSPNNVLVDFVNGSVLNESDLDTSYLHNFYLTQEYSDSFNEIINNAFLAFATDTGISETETDAIIIELVTRMLSDAAAANLQARISDIDANAEAIITLGDALQVQINTLAEGVAAAVYIQATEPVPGVGGIPNPIPEGARWYDSDDNNHPYIYQSGAWLDIDDPRIGQALAQISVLQVEVDDNQAAIVSEQVVRANADSAIASDLSLLGAANGGDTAFILDLNTVEVVAGVETLASRFSTITADAVANANAASTNSSDITAEQIARANGDSANASDITALDSRVTTAEGTIVTQASAISVLQTDVSTAEGNISANAAAITAVESDVDLRASAFYQATPPVARAVNDLWFDSDDGNKLYRWNGATWVVATDTAIAANASAISGLTTDIDTNTGNISANASAITSVQASITSLDGEMNTAQVDIIANASAVTNVENDIIAVEAEFGVDLTANGYVSGFRLINGGTPGASAFVILADKFAIVDPSGDPAEPEYVPFTILNGKVRFNADVEIDGNLVVSGTINGSAMINGTIGSTQIGANSISTTHISSLTIQAGDIAANAITADKINVTNLSAVNADLGSITAGTITLDTAGWIKGGQTAYDTGTGFFLGYSGAAYKFSIGNGTTQKLTWDGTELEVLGNVIVGTYIVDATETVAEANTERSKTGSTYTEVKKFTMDRGGEVRVSWDYKSPDSSYAASNIRVKVNGTTKNSNTYNVVANYTNDYWDLTGANSLNPGDIVTIEYLAGKWWSDGPEPGTIYIKNAQLRAVVTLPGTVTVNTD